MISRLRKFIKWPAFTVLGLTMLFLSNDVLQLSVAEQAAAPYIYDLFNWETSNFMSKWVHRVRSAPPFASSSEEEKRQQINEFFRLTDEIRGVQRELDQESAGSAEDKSARTSTVQASLDGLSSSVILYATT